MAELTSYDHTVAFEKPRIAALREKFPMGCRFKYSGIWFTVCKHTKTDYTLSPGFLATTPVPYSAAALSAHYCDAQGKLCKQTFSYDTAMAIPPECVVKTGCKPEESET